MKVTVSEIMKNLQGTNTAGAEAKNQINDLKHKKAFNQNSKKKNKKKNEQRISSLWNISKRTNIQMARVPEGEQEEQEIEKLFEKNNEGELP